MTPIPLITLACQRLRRHQRLWPSLVAKDARGFATLVRQAQRVCRPLHSPATPLDWLRHTLRLG